MAHALEDALKHVTPLSAEALEVTCDGCGSVMVFEPPEVAGACSFCGSDDRRAAQVGRSDDRAGRGAAGEGHEGRWRRKKCASGSPSRWFAPNALQKMAQQEGIAGVYLPFWTYAGDTESQYSGARGVHYWETEYLHDDR